MHGQTSSGLRRCRGYIRYLSDILCWARDVRPRRVRCTPATQRPCSRYAPAVPSFEDLEEADLHLRFFVDVNFLTDNSPAAVYLREMRDAYRIRLTLAVVGEEELNDSSNPDVRDLAADYEVALGIGVYGESRWGRSLWGNEAEREELAGILTILTSTGATEENTSAFWPRATPGRQIYRDRPVDLRYARRGYLCVAHPPGT